MQAEAKRYLEALERAGVAKNSASFSVTELYTVADRINLQVHAVGQFLNLEPVIIQSPKLIAGV